MPRLAPEVKQQLSNHASALGSHGARVLWSQKKSASDRAGQTRKARLALARKIAEKRAPVVVPDVDDDEDESA